MKQGIIFRIYTGTVPLTAAILLLSWAASDVLAVPPPPSSGDYTNSAHGGGGDPARGVYRGASTATGDYARGNCAHCHDMHASRLGAPTSPYANATPYDYLTFADASGSAFCYNCHGAAGPGKNIQSAYQGQYGHGEGNTSPDTPIPCTDCHNPHFAGFSHTPAVDGNDATSGAIKGATGVEPNSWPNPAGVAGTEVDTAPVAYTVVNSITKEYQLCFKCHSNYNGGPVGGGSLTNQAAEFNPNNFSHHPVTGTNPWRNPNIQLNYQTVLKPPWNANLNARMHCSDCHGDPLSGTNGPHGSNTKYLLKAWGSGPGGSPSNSTATAECYDQLCLLCHADEYDTGGPTGTTWGHASNAAHQYSGETAGDNTLGCRACHGGPAGRADLAYYGTPSNGGRSGAMHGEKFKWANPSLSAKGNTWASPNRADHFLLGGYLTAFYFAEQQVPANGADGEGFCVARGTGSDPCGSMNNGQTW